MEQNNQELEEYHHKEKQISVRPGSVVLVCDTLHNTNNLHKLLFVVHLQMTTEIKKKVASEEDEKNVTFWGNINLFFQ
jgi:hypothetical protein